MKAQGSKAIETKLFYYNMSVSYIFLRLKAADREVSFFERSEANEKKNDYNRLMPNARL